MILLFGVTGEQSSLHPHHSAFDEDPQVQGGCSQCQRQDVADYHRHRYCTSLIAFHISEAGGITVKGHPLFLLSEFYRCTKCFLRLATRGPLCSLLNIIGTLLENISYKH